MSKKFTAEEEQKIQQMMEDMRRKDREQRIKDEARWRLLNDRPESKSKR